MKKLILPALLLTTLGASAQLYIDGATFFIDNGAVVTVQGDVTSNTNILVNGAAGTGKLRIAGTGAQLINMNGFVIPNLQIDKASGTATLAGHAQVSNLIEFTAGKIMLGNFNLTHGATGTFTGAGTGKFAETDGTGEFRKNVTAVGNYILPIGNGTDYTPLTYQIAGSTFSSAFVGASSEGVLHPNKHPRSSDYLSTHWKLNRSGVTGGTVNTVGTYAAGDVVGVEDAIYSIKRVGSNWEIGTGGGAGTVGKADIAANTVSATMATNSSDLYGMNRFLQLNTKVFLQGALTNPADPLMRDDLRKSAADVSLVGAVPGTNLLPTSDPYRTAPYNATFTHVANSSVEMATATAFTNKANPDSNVVDWVYVELRNTVTPSNAVVQTRSVLLTKDGDLVDIDGVSPVYFKDLAPGDFTVAIRHRNHLAISTKPGTFAQALNLNPNVTQLNFATLAAANLNGAVTTNYLNASGKNIMYAGNANFNGSVRYSGASNDLDYLLGTSLGGNSVSFLTNVYNSSDLNMNRAVRYSGANNDNDYLLAQPLIGISTNFRLQSLPQ